MTGDFGGLWMKTILDETSGSYSHVTEIKSYDILCRIEWYDSLCDVAAADSFRL